MANNHFEARARQLKTAALTRHITELVSLLGLTPQADGFLVAELVRGFSDKDWNAAAINIGKKPNGNRPLVGIETRLAVLAWFGEQQRRAS